MSRKKALLNIRDFNRSAEYTGTAVRIGRFFTKIKTQAQAEPADSATLRSFRRHAIAGSSEPVITSRFSASISGSFKVSASSNFVAVLSSNARLTFRMPTARSRA
ncbi:hypothetical protein SAMN05216386_2777 [Nitrosospira briensis]|uniref:Uncharacterized protein n=1 Tax=Nitrosospira briensis TaxID=35799 RepID=A0A1I5EVR8_9PROT|nr:hypothetical protein SAMN05216386_2777 [Nitrosospira briensis]